MELIPVLFPAISAAPAPASAAAQCSANLLLVRKDAPVAHSVLTAPTTTKAMQIIDNGSKGCQTL